MLPTPCSIREMILVLAIVIYLSRRLSVHVHSIFALPFPLPSRELRKIGIHVHGRLISTGLTYIQWYSLGYKVVDDRVSSSVDGSKTRADPQ